MRRSESPPVLDLRFSWSREALYFLVVPRMPFPEARVEVDFYLGDSAEPAGAGATGRAEPSGDAAGALLATLGFVPTHRVRVAVAQGDDGLSATAVLSRAPFDEIAEGVPAAIDQVIEVQVTWTAIDTGGADPVFVGAVLSAGGRTIDVFPSTGARASPLP
jgi:hypothetical protein